MGITATLYGPSTTLYSGGAVAQEVPYTLPIALAGRAYRISVEEYQRDTIDSLRQAMDTMEQPGEQSLNTVGMWRRTGHHWGLGAGQRYFDERDTSNQQRFNESKGIDIWTTRQLSLLPDTELKTGSTAFTQIIRVGESYIYAHAGSTTVSFTTTPNLTNPAWDASATLTGNAVDMCTDGTRIYVATTSGIRYVVAGADPVTVLAGAVNADFIEYGNGYLFAGVANVLKEISSGGTTTDLYTHLSTGFRFVTATGSPAGVFVGGNNADRGEFFFVGFNQTSGGLAATLPAGALPRGEFIRCMYYYGGLMILGTSRGLRLAAIVDDRGLSYGPVITAPGNVTSLDVDEDFVWFSWSNYDGSSTGLGRARLSTFVSELVPAYASDLMAGVSGVVSGVVSFGGRRYFLVTGSGVWGERQTPRLVAEGRLSSGRIAYSTTEEKIAQNVEVRHEPLVGTVGIEIETADGNVYFAGESFNPGSTRPTSQLGGGNLRSETLEIIVVLTRDTVAPATGPTLNRWTLRSQIVPLQTDAILLPIIMATSVDTMLGEGRPVHYEPLEEFLFLKSLEESRAPVTLQEGTLSQQVVVDKVSVRPNRFVETDHRWFQGKIYVRCYTIETMSGA